MRYPAFFTLIAAAILSGSALRAADLPAVYAKIDEAAGSFKGLTADIKRVAHMDLINEDDPETGKITVKRSKPKDIKMRIDFETPTVKQVAFSGTRGDIYYPKTNSAEEYDLGSHKSMVEQFLLLGFGSTSKDLRDNYNIQLIGPDTIDGKPTTHIQLIPKSKDMAQTFPKVELWISDATGLALQQKLYEKGGKDYQLATYSNMKLRPDISDNDVKLKIPANAQKSKPLSNK